MNSPQNSETRYYGGHAQQHGKLANSTGSSPTTWPYNNIKTGIWMIFNCISLPWLYHSFDVMFTILSEDVVFLFYVSKMCMNVWMHDVWCEKSCTVCRGHFVDSFFMGDKKNFSMHINLVDFFRFLIFRVGFLSSFCFVYFAVSCLTLFNMAYRYALISHGGGAFLAPPNYFENGKWEMHETLGYVRKIYY